MINDDKLLGRITNYNPGYIPVYEFAWAPKAISLDDNLYDYDHIAAQGLFKNMFNNMLNGIDATQQSADLYTKYSILNKIAGIEGRSQASGALYDLDVEKSLGLSDMEYSDKKTKLNSELNSLYKSLADIEKDVAENDQELKNNPVSKWYSLQQSIVQSSGNDASTMAFIKYSLPNTFGSSLGLLASAYGAGFFSKFVAKRVTQAAVSYNLGPQIGTIVTAGSAVASFLAPLIYSRHNESKSEVGGAVDNQFKSAKANLEYELGRQLDPTNLEDKRLLNGLYKDAWEGADTMYNKNMSLIVLDALQAALIPWIGKGLKAGALANTSKLTRFGSRATGIYAGAKAEELEEGLQFTFEHNKLKNKDLNLSNSEFYKSLVGDYVDVLGSMEFGPIHGNGKYADDNEFQFATRSGFMLGMAMMGPVSIGKTYQDIKGYREANKALKDNGVIDTDNRVLRLKDEIYQSFFDSKKAGRFNAAALFGISSNGEDRVHFLKEGVKKLNKVLDENGAPVMSKAEVKQELSDIDQAFETYNSISSKLDDIVVPYGKSATFAPLASIFKSQLFHSTLSHQRSDAKRINLTNQIYSVLTPSGTDSNSSDDLVNTIIDNKKSFIEKNTPDSDNKTKKLKALEDIRPDSFDYTYSDQVTDKLTTLVSEMVNETLFTNEHGDKLAELDKVKTYKDLVNWAKNTAATATANHVDTLIEETLNESKSNAKKVRSERKTYETLTEDEKSQRKVDNINLLLNNGVGDSAYLPTLSEDELEGLTEDLLSDLEVGNLTIPEHALNNEISKLTTEEEFNKFKARPIVRAQVESLHGKKSLQEIKDILNSRPKDKSVKPKKTLSGTHRSRWESIGRDKDQDDVRTSIDLLNEMGTKGGEVSQKDALQFVINSKFATPQEKALAKALLKITKSDSKLTIVGVSDNNSNNLDRPGQYEATKDVITIDIRYSASEYENSTSAIETVILHEIIHRHTVNTIKNNPELYARLDKLYKYLLTPNPDIPVDAQKYYGMHNMFELLTEGMTNPLFQGYLKSIKYDAGGTLWQEFLNLVNKALEHLGVKVSSTALDEVISIVSSSAISGNIGDLYIELSKAATNEFSTAPADKLASIFDSFSNKIAQYKSSGLLDDATSKNMIRLINQLMADRARSLELIETNEKTITISGHAVEVGDYVLFGGAIGSSSNVEALRKITGIGVDRSGNKIALSVYNNVITKIKDGDNVLGVFKTIAEYRLYQTQRASGVAEAQQEHFTPIILGNSVNDYDYKIGRNQDGVFFLHSASDNNNETIETFETFGDLRKALMERIKERELKLKSVNDASSTISEDLFNKLVTISKKLVDKVELTDEENFLINSPAIVGYQKIFNALITVQSKHRTQQHELNKIDLSKVAENSFTNNNKDNKLGSLYIGSTNSFLPSFNFRFKDKPDAIDGIDSNFEVVNKKYLENKTEVDKFLKFVDTIDKTIPIVKIDSFYGKDAILNIDKLINAKYDADLDALEQSLSTPQEANKAESIKLDLIKKQMVASFPTDNLADDILGFGSVYGVGEDSTVSLLQKSRAFIDKELNEGRTNLIEMLKNLQKIYSKDKIELFYNKIRTVYPTIYAQLSGKGFTDSSEFLLNIMNNKYSVDDIFEMLNSTQQRKKLTKQESFTTVGKFVPGPLYKTSSYDTVKDMDDPTQRATNRRRAFKSVLTTSSRTIDELGYRGLLVRDHHSFPSNGEYSQILKDNPEKAGVVMLIVDKNNVPIKFNDNGIEDANGEVMTLPMELAKTIYKKLEGDLKPIARYYNISLTEGWEDVVKTQIRIAAEHIEKIREKVLNGSKINVRLTDISGGIPKINKVAGAIASIPTTTFIGKNLEIYVVDIKFETNSSTGYMEGASSKDPSLTGPLGSAHIKYSGNFMGINNSKLSKNLQELILYALTTEDDLPTGLQAFINSTLYTKTAHVNLADRILTIKGDVISEANYEAALAGINFSIDKASINTNVKIFKLNDSKLQSYVGAYNDLVFESATINYAVDTRTGLPFLANTYITYDVEDIPENIPQSIIPNDNVNIVTDDEAVNTLNNLDIKLNETQEELINKLNQAQDALKDLPKFDANNKDLFGFGEIIDSEFSSISENDLNWFNTTFKASYTLKDRELKFINTIVNSDRWGSFTENGVVLLQGAPRKTLYHEAWHEFSQMYLTKDEKEDLYKSVKKKHKITGDKEAEEFLADEFWKFVQSGKTYIAPHKSLFQRIVSLLRSIFFNPTVSVEVLFDRLYKGDLTRYTPSKNNIMFKKLNLGITNFDGLEIFNNRLSLTAVNTIDKLIYDYLTNNNTPLNRVFHEPNLLNNAYNYAYSQVASKYSSILDMYKDQIANGADIEKVTNAFTNSNNLFSTLIKHFPEVVKYHKDNSKVFLISDDVILSIYDSEGEVILDESDDSVATTYKNDIQLSSIDGASKEIKTLIRGLTKKSSMKSVYLNAFGFPELVNFNSTWNMLALNLSGIYEFDDMLNKLSTIQDRFPEVSQLIEILVGYRNSNSLDAMDMVNKFRQDFSRYETPIYEIVFDPAKLEYKIDETTRNNFKAIRRLFETNFLEKATRYTDISVGGELILNGTIFESIKFDDLKNLNSRIEFLDAIGIKLNSNALKDKKSSDIISEGRLKLLYNALQKLYNSPGVTITNPVAQLAKNESSHINALVGLEAKYNLLNPSASMQNAEGSTVYSLMLNNTYIIIAGYLNNTAKYKTYEDLVSEPHLRFLDYKNNPYIKSSIILNQLFDLDENSEHYGKRKLVNGEFTTLSVVNISGMNVDSDNYDAGHTNTRLFVGDKMIQDFNLLLKKAGGFKEFMRAGDKAMSLGIKFSRYTQEDASTSHLPIDPKYFKTNLFGGDSMMSIMLEHLRTEVERIQNYRERGIGKDLKGGDIGNFSLFSKIIPNERAQELLIKNGIDQYKPQITVWVNKFFVGQFNSYVDLLNKTNLKVPTYGKTGHGTYLLKEKPSWVSSEFSTKSNNIPFETLIRTYIVNSFILNIEQTKLFNGDGAFYASFTKRSAKDNGTGTTTTTDKFMLDKLNQNLNTNLQGKLNGVSNEVTTSVKTVVFKDMVVSSDKYIKNYTEFIKNTFDEEKAEKLIARIVTPYSKANEGDAQGYITLDFYRIFKILQGKWSNEHEVAYRKLILHDHYSNMTPTEEVSQETIDRIIHGNNLTETELAYFSPIKAQYAGPLVYDGLFAPVYHKFSLFPLIPQVIKNSPLEHLNKKMILNNVGYGVFESGSKVVTKQHNGEFEKFYDDYNERTPVNSNDKFGTTNDLFLHYLKEQVNIAPEIHDKVIFGTQFRKLLFQNIFRNGKNVNRKIQNLYKEYSNIIDNLVKVETSKLYRELGIVEDSEGNLDIPDYEKLTKTLLAEAKKRNFNDNINNYIEYDAETKQFKNSLDAALNRREISAMIMSIINNRIVRQYAKGDLMVQVSVAGFERIGTKDDSLEYGTNGLSANYYDNGNVRKSTVKIPLTGDFKNLLYFKHSDGNPIIVYKGESNDVDLVVSIARLNDTIKINMDEDFKKAITMVGYRIPTQGLPSIEIMEVAEFLHPSAGSVIILPSEIVIKSGADFDIDKLSIFKPSIGVTNDRNNPVGYYVKPQTEFIDYHKLKEQLDLEYDTRINALRTKLTGDKNNILQALKDLSIKYNVEKGIKLDNIIAHHIISENNSHIALLQDELEFAGSITAYKFIKKSIRAMMAENLLMSSQIDTLKKVDLTEEELNHIEELNNARKETSAQLNSIITEKRSKLAPAINYKNGLQNRIIEISTEILTDPDNFLQLITPNDTSLIKDLVLKIKQKSGISNTDYSGTDIYTESTQIEKFQAGLVGKKALSIAAIANTLAQLFQKSNVSVNDKFINLFKQNSKETHIVHYLLDTPFQTKFNLADIYDEDGELKSEFISQMINAYVDTLNDDFIFYGNAGIDVAPVVFYLKFLGAGTEKIFNFINHPIIKEYIKETQSSKSMILESIKSETVKDKDAYSESLYSKLTNGYELKEIDSYVFSKAMLKSRVGESHRNISDSENASILKYFMELKSQSAIIHHLQQSTSFDTTRPSNLVEITINKNIREKVELTGMFNNASKILSSTFLGHFNVEPLAKFLMTKLLPLTSSSTFINGAVKIINKALEVDFQADVHKITNTYINDYLLYLLNNFSDITQTNGGKLLFHDITNPMFKDRKIADSYREFKSKYPELLERFSLLTNLVTEYENGIGNIKLVNKESGADIENDYIEQFKQLMKFSDNQYTNQQLVEIRMMTRKLALFGMAQSGLNKSPVSYIHIIPGEFYALYMNKAINNFNTLHKNIQHRYLENFNTLFIYNNPLYFGKVSQYKSYRYKNYITNIISTQFGKLTNFINHSGGAEGADIQWDIIGKEYGFENHSHYFIGVRSDKNAPYGNEEIDTKSVLYNEGRLEAAKAAKVTFGFLGKAMKDPRLVRNWAQVKYSDTVIAIGKLVTKGERLFPNIPKDTRLAATVAVTGGTGYAVQMAINHGKPVYVFDQTRNQWYKNIDGVWSKSEVPVLTENYAGIGTRHVNEYGKKAIRDVYENTLKSLGIEFHNKPIINGIEINSKSSSTLGRDLTNVHYATNGKSQFDIVPTAPGLHHPSTGKGLKGDTAQETWGLSVEAWYKANNTKALGLPEDDAYDSLLMLGLLRDKLNQYPELMKDIKERGGVEFLSKSTHTMGNGRWSSANSKNLFINTLLKAYIQVTDTTNVVEEPKSLPQTEKSVEKNIQLEIFDNNIDKRTTISNKEQPLEIYVDGSDIKGEGLIGFGVNLTHDSKNYSISGAFNTNDLTEIENDLEIKLTKAPSNTIMEFYGALKALENTPKNEYITIRQDLEGVQMWLLSGMMEHISGIKFDSKKQYDKWFNSLIESDKVNLYNQINNIIKFDSGLVSKFENWDGRKGYYAEDDAVKKIQQKMIQLIIDRPGKINYEWVKGHSKDRGNDIADMVAKDRANYNTYKSLFLTQYQDPKIITKVQYSDLGTTTETSFVKISDKGRLPAENNEITAYRGPNTKALNNERGLMLDFINNNMVGNPFGPYSFVKLPDDAAGTATMAFVNWLIGAEYSSIYQKYRQLLLNNINKIKGKQINYYTDLGRPSHATALDYLVNNPNSPLNKTTNDSTNNKPDDLIPPCSGGASI